MMKAYLRSIITAFVIAGLVLVFTVRVVAPLFPPYVGRADVEKTWEGSWQGKNALCLDNPDGFVLILVQDRPDIAAEAEIKAFAQDDVPEADIHAYVDTLMEVVEDGQTLRLTTEPGERPGHVDALVFYKVRVPEGTTLDINSDNGNVWIRGGCGDATVKGSNCDVRIERPLGHVSVRTVNGRIEASMLRKGADFKTVNGNVKADCMSGQIEAETTNGFVHARILGPSVTSCDLTSRNGGIKVFVSKDCGVEVDARTRLGTIVSDLAFDSIETRNRRTLVGKAGAGTARLTMATLNGDIRLVRSE